MVLITQKHIPALVFESSLTKFHQKSKNHHSNAFPQLSLPFNPIDFCADRESIRMLVIVSSALWHFERRDIIRKTWAKTSGPDIKVLFHVGVDYNGDRQLQATEEFEKYKDIVQVDIGEHYTNLTDRMSDEFRWVEYFCPNVEFIMHQHDDVVPDLWSIAYGVLHSHEPFRYGAVEKCGLHVIEFVKKFQKEEESKIAKQGQTRPNKTE